MTDHIECRPSFTSPLFDDRTVSCPCASISHKLLSIPLPTLLLSSPGAGASITHTPGRSRVENRAAVNPRGLYHAPPTLQPGHPSSPRPCLGSTPPSDQQEDGIVQGSSYWFISLIYHISWDMWDLLYSVCPYDACQIWWKWHVGRTAELWIAKSNVQKTVRMTEPGRMLIHLQTPPIKPYEWKLNAKER